MSPATITDQACQRAAQHNHQLVANCLVIIAAMITLMMMPADPEPYHMSILSGQMWEPQYLTLLVNTNLKKIVMMEVRMRMVLNQLAGELR